MSKELTVPEIEELNRVLSNLTIEELDEAFLRFVIIGHLEMVKMILKAGAHADTKDFSGSSAFILGAIKGHIEIVKYFLDLGFDVDEKDEYSKNALILAVIKNHKEVVEYLLKRKINIDAQDNNGDTALIWAARYGYEEIVAHLLNFGADISLKNNVDKTALSIVSWSHGEIITMIKDYQKYVDFLNEILPDVVDEYGNIVPKTSKRERSKEDYLINKFSEIINVFFAKEPSKITVEYLGREEIIETVFLAANNGLNLHQVIEEAKSKSTQNKSYLVIKATDQLDEIRLADEKIEPMLLSKFLENSNSSEEAKNDINSNNDYTLETALKSSLPLHSNAEKKQVPNQENFKGENLEAQELVNLSSSDIEVTDSDVIFHFQQTREDELRAPETTSQSPSSNNKPSSKPTNPKLGYYDKNKRSDKTDGITL